MDAVRMELGRASGTWTVAGSHRSGVTQIGDGRGRNFGSVDSEDAGKEVGDRAIGQSGRPAKLDFYGIDI